MNAKLDPEVETVFLMSSEKHQFLASRLIKEIAALEGDVSPFVPPQVNDRLLARIRAKRGGS
jgi:pantetheine-phosphate adenylyltransferase